MFENLRTAVALAIQPKAVTRKIEKLNLASALTPGAPIYSDMTVKKAVREGYKMSVFVYRGVRTIIQAASAIPWYAFADDGTPLPEHELTKLMLHPNLEFSGQDMIEIIIGHLCLTGNALWQPIMTNGRITEVWPVMPDLVQPIPSKAPGKWLDGWQINEESRQRIVPPETFIHFMQTDPGNPYWGIGPLMAAARTIDTDNEAQDTQKVSMQNRGIPSGILSPTDSEMTADELEEIKKRFKAEHGGKISRREPWILNKGIKWEQMSLSAVEMDYTASRLQNKRDVSAALGISPIFLGDLEQSSYNNMMEARKALYQDVVIPMLDDIRATLRMRVAPAYGVDIGYDTSNVEALRDDFNKKVTSAQTLWAMGVPFDQINNRLEMGFEEFTGWDRSYIPFSLMPAGGTSVQDNGQAVEGQQVADTAANIAAGDKLNGIQIKRPTNKAFQADTEEQKTQQWKRIDSRRMGWWAVIGKRIEPLYGDLSDAIVKALKDKTETTAPKAAASAINGQTDSWLKVMTAAYMSIIEDVGNQTASDMGMKPKSAKAQIFDPFSAAAVKWIKSQATLTVKAILATDLEAVKAIILNGFTEGQGIPAISKLIRGFYDDNSAWKAARVARTEVAKAAGFGQHEAAAQSGVVETKKWLTARDSTVRDSHADLEGEEQPLNGTYSNGLEFPGDPSGDPSEVINCRCTELYGF